MEDFESDVEWIETIARKHGALRTGGRIDLHKVSEILLHELRQGTIGNIILKPHSHPNDTNLRDSAQFK